MGVSTPGGLDPYGYRLNQYNQHLYATGNGQQEERLDFKDMAFFNTVNQF
jgi:hypothetical protein